MPYIQSVLDQIKMRLRLPIMVFGVIIIALIMSTFPSHSFAQNQSQITDYIFKVTYPPKWLISEAIFAYEYQGQYYFPLAALAYDFEFFTDLDLNSMRVSGYASTPDNSFSIDVKAGSLTIQGVREDLPVNAVLLSEQIENDDLYVELSILNRMWPISMYMDLSNLEIITQTETDLPFVLGKKREDNIAKFKSRRSVGNQYQNSTAIDPRAHIIGKPVLDVQSTYQYNTDTDEIQGTNTLSGVQNVLGIVADFATNFSYRNGEIDEPENVRLRISDNSLRDAYLLPGIRSYQLGDVSLRPRDLIDRTVTGRGLIVSNDTGKARREFDRIALEGSAPPGWDIELYRNEQLIDFGVVPDDGRYVLDDVSVNFGNNTFKFLFFGPQGQVREEIRQVNSGSNMVAQGEFEYSAGLLDSNRNFIPINERPNNDITGLSTNIDMAYGLSKSITLFSNYSQVPYTDEDRNYTTFGGIFSTPIGFLETELYKELGAGHAFSVAHLGGFKGLRSNIRTSIYDDFESQESGFGNNKKQYELDTQVSKNIRAFGAPFDLQLRADHIKLETGEKNTDVQFSQSYIYKGLRLSHSNTWQTQNDTDDIIRGAITSTYRQQDMQIRSSAQYRIAPDTTFESITLDWRNTPKDGWRKSVNISHNFDTSVYRIGGQLGYDFGSFIGSADAAYDKDTGWEFIVRASTSLNPYTLDKEYAFDSTVKKQTLPIRAHVFWDKDRDGLFNNDDENVEDVQILIGSGRSKEKTNTNGLLITNANDTDDLLGIAVDGSSIPDPYLRASSDGFRIIPKRGHMIDVAFPLIETGTIEGFVYKDNSDKPAPGLNMDLLDQQGQKLMSVTSASDGYYVFEFVPPGHYTIKPRAEIPLYLTNKMVQVPANDVFVYGHDMKVLNGQEPVITNDVNGFEVSYARQK